MTPPQPQTLRQCGVTPSRDRPGDMGIEGGLSRPRPPKPPPPGALLLDKAVITKVEWQGKAPRRSRRCRAIQHGITRPCSG